MISDSIIDIILGAHSIHEVMDVEDIDNQYKRILAYLHPDRNKQESATAAFIRLNHLKSKFDKGKFLEDDAGKVEVGELNSLFRGTSELLEKSYENYVKLRDKRDDASLAFHKYLPESVGISNHIQVDYRHRSLPMSRLVLPQEHILWILSRMLEFTAWMEHVGYVHAGIHPESVWVVPETHGIILNSFYHMTKKNHPLKTISARYKHWYPTTIFKDKRARHSIDLELVKRTACYLAGDSSGMGIKLRKSHHPALIEFLLKKHHQPFECYDEYRNMLRNNFEVRFHKLTI